MSEKLDRDALKGPDEFTLLVRRLVSWSRANRRLLTVGATIVGVALIVVAIGTWNRARSQRQAAENFRRAHAAFRADRFTEAARAFDDLQRDYPATAFGRIAGLYYAHALRAAGDAGAAATAYDAVLAAGGLAPEYQQLALFSLGQLREDAGRAEDAVTLYERAAGLAGPYSLDVEIAMARLQLELGRREDAQATYERILPDASGDMKALVEARLASLRAGS